MYPPNPTSSQGVSSIAKEWKMPGKAPVPMYRHAMPSGPWPWMNFNRDITPGQLDKISKSPSAPSPQAQSYPESHFPNWKLTQVERSTMLHLTHGSSTIYYIDVHDDASFTHGKCDAPDNTGWEQRPKDTRVRALFVDNMTVDVLQLLGSKYNVEPFFFTSSVNWIPSTYQEDPTTSGDHITITLPFIRAVPCPKHVSHSSQHTSFGDSSVFSRTIEAYTNLNEVIDTQAPLNLRFSDRLLVLDLMSIHLVRSPTDGNTIISYHPNFDEHRTSAEKMQGLLYFIGQSVYWNKIFTATADPTFVLMAMLWYALYSWDEAFEILYKHINQLESSVINTTEIHLTRELHVIQAHLLYYATLLDDFRHTVEFILETPHPGLATFVPNESAQIKSNNLLEREGKNLLSAITRMQNIRDMHSKRLENVMRLAFATVNIDDSRAMKQISYLSMIFLPAGFTGTVFGMNVKEINSGSYETLGHYVLAAVLLTALTIWTAIAFQANSRFHGSGPRRSFWARLCWPVRLLVTRSEDLHAKYFQRPMHRRPLNRQHMNSADDVEKAEC